MLILSERFRRCLKQKRTLLTLLKRLSMLGATRALTICLGADSLAVYILYKLAGKRNNTYFLFFFRWGNPICSEIFLPAPLKKAMAEQAKARKQSTAAVYLMVPGSPLKSIGEGNKMRLTPSTMFHLRSQKNRYRRTNENANVIKHNACNAFNSSNTRRSLPFGPGYTISLCLFTTFFPKTLKARHSLHGHYFGFCKWTTSLSLLHLFVLFFWGKQGGMMIRERSR